MKIFLTRVWNALKDRRWLFAAFFLPSLLLFAAYSFSGFAPFGDKSVLVLDLAGQYVWFYEGLWDAVRGGGNLFYSLSRSLGGEFLGIYAYYLASPFTWLILLFPKSQIMTAVTVLLFLKTGCIGTTMYYYLSKKTPTLQKSFTLALSAAYALCGYAVALGHNLMWTDTLILLPLLVYGLEQLIDRRKCGLYTAALSLIILSNYYMGYMAGLFSVGYFLLYSVAHKPEKERIFSLKFRKNVTDFIVFSAFSLFFSTFVWLPGLYALTMGKAASGSASLLPFFRFSLFDFAEKLLPGTYDSLLAEGLPFVYCGLAVLLLLPSYFISKKAAKREKIVRGAGMLFLVLCMWVHPLDLVWHGFREPNCLNFRYAFFLSFLLITTAAKGLTLLTPKARKSTLTLAGVFGVFTIILFLTSGTIRDPLPFLIISLTALAACGVLLFLLPAKGAKIRLLSAIFCAVLCGELTANAVLTFRAMDADAGFTQLSDFSDASVNLSAKYERLKELDSGFYRTETTDHKRSNENMGAGLYGVSGSTSTLHAGSLAFLRAIGYPSTSHWSSYTTPNPFADSLLGLRYCLSSGDIPFYASVESGIFRNNAALSLCYRVAGTALSFGNNAADNCNTLARVLTDTDNGDVFTALEGEKTYQTGGTLYDAEGGTYVFLRDKGETATAMVFTVTAERDGALYFLLPSPTGSRVIFSCNNTVLGTEFDKAGGYFVYLGNFAAGETVRVQLTFPEKTNSFTYYQGQTHFYRFEEANSAAYLALLAAGNADFTADYDARALSGTLAGASTYLLTLPYDKCLAVYVGGTRVKTYEAFGGLTAFEADGDGLSLSVRYIPVTLYIGMGISALTCTLFVVYWHLKKKKSISDTEEN